MHEYVENSRTALDTAFTLSSGLDVLAQATSELQQKIAPPPVPVPAYKLGEIPRWGTPFAEQLALWEQAVNQVETVYSAPAIRAAHAVAELIGPGKACVSAPGRTRTSRRRAGAYQTNRPSEPKNFWRAGVSVRARGIRRRGRPRTTSARHHKYRSWFR